MENDRLFYFLWGLSVGVILTCFFLLRVPGVSERAYEAGLRLDKDAPSFEELRSGPRAEEPKNGLKP